MKTPTMNSKHNIHLRRQNLQVPGAPKCSGMYRYGWPPAASSLHAKCLTFPPSPYCKWTSGHITPSPPPPPVTHLHPHEVIMRISQVQFMTSRTVMGWRIVQITLMDSHYFSSYRMLVETGVWGGAGGGAVLYHILPKNQIWFESTLENV